jgi:hypothetical protein
MRALIETAAITGTITLLKYHPAYIKFITLKGSGRIFRNNRIGESVLLHARQMLIVNPKGKGLPDPVDVDLDRLVKTSPPHQRLRAAPERRSHRARNSDADDGEIKRRSVGGNELSLPTAWVNLPSSTTTCSLSL